MKLNTKNIFVSSSSKKIAQKKKNQNQKKSKINSPFINSNKVTQKLNSNNNINFNKNKKTLQNSNKKVNPFILPSEKNQDLKYHSKLSKFPTQKIKINIDIDVKNDKNDLFEDSYVNNMALTSESDTNNNKGNKENINNKQNQNELGLEGFNLFKKSNLKSTIIVDDNGNNNLDIEQKKIINDYFNKKKMIINNVNSNKKYFNNFQRSKTRKVSTQIYRDNNLFNKIYRLKSGTIGNIDKNINNDKTIEKKVPNKNIIESYSKNNNNHTNIENNYDIGNKNRKIIKKMKSTKINSCFFINKEKFLSKKIETKVEKENNSFLDNNSYYSFDSSFLGSSMDEDFYKTLNNN